MIKRHLAQLINAERRIAAEMAVDQLQAQLDVAQSDAYNRGLLAGKTVGYREGKSDQQHTTALKLQDLERSLSDKDGQLKQLQMQVAERNKKLSNQAVDHNNEVAELKQQLKTFNDQCQQPVLLFDPKPSLLVANWRESYKWISNWCWGLVMFIAVTPIPPELLAVLPEHIRMYVIAAIAVCGFVGRYINQSKTL